MDYKSWNTPSARPRGAHGCKTWADSLLIHNTMLSSKQPVSTYEDSLPSITNHMLSHRSTCSWRINGCYVQVLGKNTSILPGVCWKFAAARGTRGRSGWRANLRLAPRGQYSESLTKSINSLKLYVFKVYKSRSIHFITRVLILLSAHGSLQPHDSV